MEQYSKDVYKRQGGSRGIGFATADKFLKEGASVVLAASSPVSYTHLDVYKRQDNVMK